VRARTRAQGGWGDAPVTTLMEWAKVAAWSFGGSSAQPRRWSGRRRDVSADCAHAGLPHAPFPEQHRCAQDHLPDEPCPTVIAVVLPARSRCSRRERVTCDASDYSRGGDRSQRARLDVLPRAAFIDTRRHAALLARSSRVYSLFRMWSWHAAIRAGTAWSAS
jgi:hypothetical protein